MAVGVCCDPERVRNAYEGEEVGSWSKKKGGN